MTTLAREIVEITLAAWLLLSVYGKLADVDAARRAFASYRAVPPWAVRSGPYLVSAVECIIAVSLLFAVPPDAGLAFAAVLLVFFGAVMAVDICSGRIHACGCGGEPRLISWSLVARNGATALLAGGALLFPSAASVPFERLAFAGVVFLGCLVARSTRELAGIRRWVAS